MRDIFYFCYKIYVIEGISNCDHPDLNIYVWNSLKVSKTKKVMSKIKKTSNYFAQGQKWNIAEIEHYPVFREDIL